MSRRAIAGIVVLICAVGMVLGAWWFIPSNVPDPPVVSDLSQADPAVIKLIQHTVSETVRARGDPGAWFTLGKVYDVNEFDEAALRCYDQVATMGLADAELWYHRSVVHNRLGQLESAVSDLREVVARSPNYVPALSRLGSACLDLGQLEEGEAAFRQAIKVEHRDAAGWIGLARVLIERGQYQAAVDVLEKVLASASTNRGYAYQLLASACRALGRDEEAELASTRGQGSAPQWPDPWRDRLQPFNISRKARLAQGKDLLDANQVDAAIASLSALYREWPEEPCVATNLGMAYGRARRFDESIDVLHEVVTAHPSYAPGHLNLATSLLGKSQEPGANPEALRERANAHVEQALALNPGLGMAHALRAALLQAAGNRPEALREYEEAARCEPAKSEWLYAAAGLQFDMQQFSDAARSFEFVTRRAPDSPDGYYGLGMSMLRLGRAVEAEAALGRADQLSPRNPRILAALNEARAQRAAGPQLRPDG